jgi:type I restriction enzyme S subunit
VALPSFKGVCSADMYPLIPKDGFNKVFLKYIFTQKAFLEYAISHSGRANIPKINREDLLNYEFLTYPIQEQRKFASKIEAIEKQKELIKQSIQETETLFNSRMDYYFN